MGAKTARLEELAAKTPATRDRYVDFLRAFSIVAVVFGHWFIGINYWQNGIIGTHSALGVTPGLWIVTWFLMVMPIFFFVGGFSNMVTLQAYRRRGNSVASFLRSRAWRLLKPSLVFIGVWTVIQLVLHLTDTGGQAAFLRGMRPPGATVPFGPLWFLAVYLGVILVSPVMVKLHERFRWYVPATLLIGIIGVDIAAFGFGLTWIRLLNGAFVWLLPHQLGFFYADGTLQAWSKRAYAAVAGAGIVSLAILTNIGVYPRSMLGTDVERVSNVNPPTICIAAVSFWMLGVALLLRRPLTRWLQRPRPWMITIYLNSVIMTLFLWHMTAYLLAMLALMPLGIGTQTDSTTTWWLERPIWELVPAAFLALLVAIFGRFERPRTQARSRHAPLLAP